MLSQEEFMDVQALKRQGLTITEIARELGYRPATISAWLAVSARRHPTDVLRHRP